MSFYSDPAFFVFAAIAVVPAIIAGVLSKSLRGYGLVVSVLFLGCMFASSPLELGSFLFFVVWSCALAFITLKLFKDDAKHKVGIYRLLLALALAPLAVVKVTAVFDLNIFGFLGISYITFKSVQVLIEIRDGLISEMRLVDYLYFLIFFVPFTSGPIMRSRDFVEQISVPRGRADYLELLSKGCWWFIKGVVYSFVFAALAQWLMWFGPSAIGTGSTAAAVGSQLVQAFSYGLYLFFDFAGYSSMAMGLGAALGIRVPDNFKAPFRAIDIKDFWNRWHITLSFWLRDFVFMRLTRSFMKRKVFSSRVTTACTSYVVNMFVMGVWHGITPDYLLYGLFHGVLLALCELRQKKSKFYKKHRKETWYKLGTWAITMIAVFFGFALFSGQVTTGLIGVING